MDDSVYLSAYESLLYSFKLDMAAAVAEERYEEAAVTKKKSDVVKAIFASLIPPLTQPDSPSQ